MLNSSKLSQPPKSSSSSAYLSVLKKNQMKGLLCSTEVYALDHYKRVHDKNQTQNSTSSQFNFRNSSISTKHSKNSSIYRKISSRQEKPIEKKQPTYLSLSKTIQEEEFSQRMRKETSNQLTDRKITAQDFFTSDLRETKKNEDLILENLQKLSCSGLIISQSSSDDLRHYQRSQNDSQQDYLVGMEIEQAKIHQLMDDAFQKKKNLLIVSKILEDKGTQTSDQSNMSKSDQQRSSFNVQNNSRTFCQTQPGFRRVNHHRQQNNPLLLRAVSVTTRVGMFPAFTTRRLLCSISHSPIRFLR